MLLDRGEMRADVGDKCVRVSIAEKCRDPFQAGATRRQHMRLRVVDHLQAVLKASEKAVVVNQSRGDRRIDGGRSASHVGPTCSWYIRPPQISCWVCAKNSISRIPPRPVFMSWPSTAMRP